LVGDLEIPKHRGRNRKRYWINRSEMDTERDEDYPTPRCFIKGIEFLKKNGNEDNWHLHLEVFDPHEPFMAPKKYLEKFDDTWDSALHYDWPAYAPLTADEGPKEIDHIRKMYAATLTMADVWLGKFLDKMDELDMWKDTTVIFSTDHGHLLGEHGYWAKNYMFDYEELVHVPLIICTPNSAGAPKRVSALTAAIDIMPTIMEMHGAKLPHVVHGRSLVHLLNKDEPHHDAVLYGFFGKDINMTDGRFTYCRQPLADTTAYSHTLMPTMVIKHANKGQVAAAETGMFQAVKNYTREQLQKAETGVFLNHCHNIPHLRIAVPSGKHVNAPDFNPIYDLSADPFQTRPVHDDALEEKLAAKLKVLMKRYEAPESEFVRVGL